MTVLSVGRGGLRQLHQSLLQHTPDQAIAVLQEAGYASGQGIYESFCAWLPSHTGVGVPGDLDAAHFPGALSAFLQSSGWGSVTVRPLGGAALALDSADWAEAEPGTAGMPMCFFSSGMLADFLGRVSTEPVAVMEVECRSKGDAQCRFLSASQETLQQVYEAMTQGRTYEDALAGT
ncbi:MAG TPA: V4R domain-containing protein [Gemmatimonadales bacterium]|nr:V4R domain-containing protein [Gemmatimonadales bacterium]